MLICLMKMPNMGNSLIYFLHSSVAGVNRGVASISETNAYICYHCTRHVSVAATWAGIELITAT